MVYVKIKRMLSKVFKLIVTYRTWPSGYGASFRFDKAYLLVRKSEGSVWILSLT